MLAIAIKTLENTVDPVRVVIVIMHNIHQVPSAGDVGDQLCTRAVTVVYFGPFVPKLERLILPGQETKRFDNSGLRDFLTREYTPGHRIRHLLLRIRLQHPVTTHRVV